MLANPSITQVVMTIQWDTQNDTPTQSTTLTHTHTHTHRARTHARTPTHAHTHTAIAGRKEREACTLHSRHACLPTPMLACHSQVVMTIQWDTQNDSPNQSTFSAVPYTRLTRRAYATTPAAVREGFLPHWRCLLVTMRRVRGPRREGALF